MRIIVAIDAWDAHSKHPDGHYVRTLGEVGDKAVETEVILIEHDIPSNAFSAKVLACLPPEDWAITPENSEVRAHRSRSCGMLRACRTLTRRACDAAGPQGSEGRVRVQHRPARLQGH